MRKAALTPVITYFIFISLASAASGPCGQDQGAQKVLPARDQAAESLKKLCEGESPAKKMKDLAQTCKGDGGESQVVEKTDQYIQRLNDLCQASAKSVKQVADVCGKSEAANKKADDLQNKISSMGAGKKNAERMQAAVAKDSPGIKKQLGEAAGESKKNQDALGENDKGVDESKEKLGGSNEETQKQVGDHQKKFDDASAKLNACRRNCGELKQRVQRAKKNIDSAKPACRELVHAQREVDQLQKELKEKLKNLGNELGNLEKQSLAKGDEVGKLGGKHDDRLDKLTSTATDPNGNPVGKRTKESWDIPPEKSGKKPPGKVGDEQETTATWYDPAGRSSKYKKGDVTAASNYYPQGSVLEVTNAKTGQKTEVTVNDTGFFRTSKGNAYSTNINDFGPSRGVGIDLSRQAARNIGLERAGMGPVIIRRIK